MNASTTNFQGHPAVTVDGTGKFIAVWESQPQDGSGPGIFGQRFGSSGDALGGEFQVNSYTSNMQVYPVVAADASGNFVVVWTSLGADGSNYGVFGQRYASGGAPLGGEFRVNSYTTSSQVRPSVASASGGNFIVAWDSVHDTPGGGSGVFAQRYSSTGAPLGGEFRVNSFTTNSQLSSSTAAASTGDFVVVWQSYQEGSSTGIFGQRYASSGAALGSEFQVNSYTSSFQRDASVAADAGGNWLVAWRSLGQDGGGEAVIARRYASTGAALGAEFQVNSFTTNDQLAPAVAANAAGDFLVVWQGGGQDGSNTGIFGQRYAGSGASVGSEFRANAFTINYQTLPAVGIGPAGDFVVVWQSYLHDGSSHGVFAQRFCVDPLTTVSVSTMGSLSVCASATGGSGTVATTGGGTTSFQWYYRTSIMGSSTAIPGETAVTYVVKGSDFAGGTPGTYFLYCQATPSCGAPTFSAETIMITVTADAMPPSVTAPSSVTTPQSLCQ